jgi:hypothetical protein
MEIAFEDGGGMRAYANRHGLYVTYFRVIGLQLAVFPYSGNDQQIGDEDVIYVLDSDVWRLQDDDFNALVAGQSPVPADVNGTASV